MAIEPNDYRRAKAAEMGADVVLDPTEVDPVQAVLGLTNGAGAEVVLEMSGNARAIDQGTRLLARGGRMSLLGLPDGAVALDLNDQVIFKEARLQGITGREMFRTWQQTTTLLSTGRVDVAPVITHRFPLERVRRGVRHHGVGALRQGHPAALRRAAPERGSRGSRRRRARPVEVLGGPASPSAPAARSTRKLSRSASSPFTRIEMA